MATLRPSLKPVSLRPLRNAARLVVSGEPMSRNPITGTVVRWACAVVDHAAALPSPAINSRLRISEPHRQFLGEPIAVQVAWEWGTDPALPRTGEPQVVS